MSVFTWLLCTTLPSVISIGVVSGCAPSPEEHYIYATGKDEVQAEFISAVRNHASHHREEFLSALKALNQIHHAHKDYNDLAEPGGVGPYNQALAITYYDRASAFYNIGELLGDKEWLKLGDEAALFYRDKYLLHEKLPQSQHGLVPGYWMFTEGLRRHYERSKDLKSKEALFLLAERGRYASSDEKAHSDAESAERSREVAYGLLAHLNAEKLGRAPEERWRTSLLAFARGHIAQWRGKTSWRGIESRAKYVVPFMAALTARAIIEAVEANKIPASELGIVIEELSALSDLLWDSLWLPKEKAFRYADREVISGETLDKSSLHKGAAPDLNLLIFPLYAWLSDRTADPRHYDRARDILKGGLVGAYWTGPKQFNQQLFWSTYGIRWLNK